MRKHGRNSEARVPGVDVDDDESRRKQPKCPRTRAPQIPVSTIKSKRKVSNLFSFEEKKDDDDSTFPGCASRYIKNHRDNSLFGKGDNGDDDEDVVQILTSQIQ